MKKSLIVRYAEIHLKGRNRAYFENMLVTNIKKSLDKFEFKFEKTYGRYIIYDFDAQYEINIIEKLKKVFGIHSVSSCFVCSNTLDSITECAFNLGVESGTFKVECNRADKTFPMKSYEIAGEIGGRLLDKFPGLSVDLHEPQNKVYVDIRETKQTFVYLNNIPCSGGLPVGCSGKGMLLLSGGIDSPVAGYMMAKRGMTINAIHFQSYPFTSVQAQEKVLTLAKHLKEYTTELNVYIVPFTKIQVKIHENCPEEMMITLMRRFMMRISERLARKIGAGALITGESLGQVASQTLESITATNCVVTLPVFRPLIAFDKSDIVEIAQRISTYETSILPYEDCCTVFLPKNPLIKPKLDYIEKAENNLEIDALIDEAFENIELVRV